MSIEQNWKKMNEEGDDDLSSLLREGRLQKMHSSNPLQKIKYSLVVSIAYAILIAALYVYVLIRFPYWQVIVCIGIVLLFTIWGGYTSYIQYRNIRPWVSGSKPLLEEMEKHYTGIRDWMRLQMKVAIFIYPVAAAGGFMIGGIVGSGKSIDYFLSKPVVIIALIIAVVVLVPCCIWLAKWMFKKSYGKHLATLKKNIDALKEEK